MDASTDHGTVLPDGSYAVTWHPDTGWTLMVPSAIEGTPEKRMPSEVIALTGAFLRLSREPDFRDECRRFFMGASQ